MDHPFNLFSRLSLPPSLHYPCCDELSVYPCRDELPVYPCCDELPVYPCCDELPVYPYISDVHTERIEGGGGGLPFSQPHSQASAGDVAISSSILHLLLGQKIFKHQIFEI